MSRAITVVFCIGVIAIVVSTAVIVLIAATPRQQALAAQPQLPAAKIEGDEYARGFKESLDEHRAMLDQIRKEFEAQRAASSADLGAFG
ncbi:MAG: hypothetical protein WA188_15495 [Terriglobales bacterium]